MLTSLWFPYDAAELFRVGLSNSLVTLEQRKGRTKRLAKEEMI
jgi:hypothetical protein